MRVLLDTNVILDAVLQRVLWHVEADAIMQALAQGKVTCAATTLSLATVFYVGRRNVGTLAARAVVRSHLTAFEVLPVDSQTLLAADAMLGSDLEDNIQIAASVTTCLDTIVTRNIADFAHSSIPVWSPADLLKRLSVGHSPAAGAGPTAGLP